VLELERKAKYAAGPVFRSCRVLWLCSVGPGSGSSGSGTG